MAMPHLQLGKSESGERLRLAASKGNTAKVVQLLESGADHDADSEGRTAIHFAAYHGHIETVSALIAADCDVNVPDFYGYTALQRAAAEGYTDIVRKIIKQGGKVDNQDDIHGNTALHEAAWKGFSRTVEALCAAKANVYLKNKGGFAPLHLACQNGHNQSCRVLLLSGCRPDVKNNYGDTPLHTAARYGHAGVVRILISAGCDVNDQNKNGDTGVHITAAMGRRKLTRILIESGSDVNLLNKQEETPFAIAERKSFNEVCEIITSINNQKEKSKNNASTKRHAKESGTSKESGECRHKHKDKHKKHGHENKGEKITSKSPYGCQHPISTKEIPDVNLDSLPKEPLKKGEQYYVDLAGNIKKGPIGIGYACYCAPFFKKFEKKMDNHNQELKKHIDSAKEDLNSKINHLEKKTRVHLFHLNEGMKECIASEKADCIEKMERAVLKERIVNEKRLDQRDSELKNELEWLVLEKSKAGNAEEEEERPGSKINEQEWNERRKRSKSEEVLNRWEYQRPDSELVAMHNQLAESGFKNGGNKPDFQQQERDSGYTTKLHSSFESQSSAATNGLPTVPFTYAPNRHVNQNLRNGYSTPDVGYSFGCVQNSSLV